MSLLWDSFCKRVTPLPLSFCKDLEGKFFLFDLSKPSEEERNALDAIAPILSLDHEASLFATQDLKFHYVLRQTLLRFILQQFMQCSINQVSFQYNDYKKPYFKAKDFPFFNFSHSKSIGFLGISYSHEIGVDIEKIMPIDKVDLLLDEFAYSSEKQWVMNGTEESLVSRFYILWTAKEALVKAMGTGFIRESIPMLSELPHRESQSFYSSHKQHKIITQLIDTEKAVLSFSYNQNNMDGV